MIWFTSDTHFGHANVLGFTDRHLRWPTIESMNDGIIDAINERVSVTDTLYILGDFSFKMTAADAKRLRGKIVCNDVHLLRGNHDKDWAQKDVAGTFKMEPPIHVLKVDGIKIVMSHYPLADWQGMSHGSWHLHGHIHSRGNDYNLANRRQGLLRYDVGVDANGYAPVSLEELKAWFDGVEAPRTRVKWPFWVNATGDEELDRDLEPWRELYREQDERSRAGQLI